MLFECSDYEIQRLALIRQRAILAAVERRALIARALATTPRPAHPGRSARRRFGAQIVRFGHWIGGGVSTAVPTRQPQA